MSSHFAPSQQPLPKLNWDRWAFRLGFGGIMGACTAYAAKVVGRTAAYYVGLGFVTLQLLSYPWFTIEGKSKAFLTVDWSVLFTVSHRSTVCRGAVARADTLARTSVAHKQGMSDQMKKYIDTDGDGEISEAEAVELLTKVQGFLVRRAHTAHGQPLPP